MIGKQKLEKLSHAWYGYTVCMTLLSIFSLRAAGLFSFVLSVSIWAIVNGICLVISLALITFFSRKLLARSSAMRTFLIAASAIASVLTAMGMLDAGRMLLHFWSLSYSLSLLWHLGLAGAYLAMNVRSLRVLTSSDVKVYFA